MDNVVSKTDTIQEKMPKMPQNRRFVLTNGVAAVKIVRG